MKRFIFFLIFIFSFKVFATEKTFILYQDESVTKVNDVSFLIVDVTKGSEEFIQSISYCEESDRDFKPLNEYYMDSDVLICTGGKYYVGFMPKSINKGVGFTELTPVPSREDGLALLYVYSYLRYYKLINYRKPWISYYPEKTITEGVEEQTTPFVDHSNLYTDVLGRPLDDAARSLVDSWKDQYYYYITTGNISKSIPKAIVDENVFYGIKNANHGYYMFGDKVTRLEIHLVESEKLPTIWERANAPSLKIRDFVVKYGKVKVQEVR